MKTLGIDLSSMPKGTAACMINWDRNKAAVDAVQLSCDDTRLDGLIDAADVVGIDAPLGWPAPFTSAVGKWISPAWNEDVRDKLRFRETDRHVFKKTRVRPLSVSSDLIALPAMRAMALLLRHKVTDRSGDGRFYEVYPAGSLAIWRSSPTRGYKGQSPESHRVRRSILRSIRSNLPWLEVAESYADDADGLDSLIASLTARAAAQGLTQRPETADQAELARTEGWIHLPSCWPSL